MRLHFPLPKIRTFRFSLHTSYLTLPILRAGCVWWEREREREREKYRERVLVPFPLSRPLLWRWNSQWVLTFHCQKISPSLSRLSQVTRLFFPSKRWIKLIPKTIGNRKRDFAWGCARGINTTRENLQIAKHKSGRRWFRSPDWFVLCQWWSSAPELIFFHSDFLGYASSAAND